MYLIVDEFLTQIQQVMSVGTAINERAVVEKISSVQEILRVEQGRLLIVENTEEYLRIVNYDCVGKDCCTFWMPV
jgi:predicted metal-dependent peptidase